MVDPLAQVHKALLRPAQASSDFDLNGNVELPAGRKLHPAAVLCAFQMSANGPQVVLTKRSSALKHHPGQIAFPGGKMDAEDSSLTVTALREAEEEIGLPRSAVDILGELPVHETVTGFRVTPILGRITEPFEPVPEVGEVAEVFTCPLSHLGNPANYLVQSRRWRGQRRYYYVVPYGPYYIWGATARMLRGLAERMTEG